ncbi:NAD(P)-binding protein [Lentinus tigrinus ALCF2SS1-7]|uniref:NAD(P)-binding protein n=1 Tax=Lentinus tigrinus ALCF2SS1-6 TaxID=1328759 RepID=A0A5C2RTP3_9APHY|nr:NAD(P)-binding protein [Lentinus tigrinus ALCF2SS1-6]RPD69268.1 NAD(P)-binding protein [Lentinus tigrinus ALCF2SS1-7]
MTTIVNVLAVLGGLLATPHLCRIASFVWLYFLRPSSIRQYLHGPQDSTYAVVTGATDGIGKATAAELLRNGFNVILHGRNETKMKKVVEELRARVPERKDADVRYFIADASAGGQDFAKLVEPYRDLHVTLVYHNVGGGDMSGQRLDERTEENIHSLVNLNALFPLFLNRALLPQLRRSAKSGPVLVNFVGSVAGDIAPPRLAVYAAGKGFLESLTRGLDNDEQFFDGPTGVRYCYLAVAAVHSDNHEAPIATSFTTPTCERFAKCILDRAGCGRRRVAPYWVHGMMQYFIREVAGDGVVDKASAEQMQGLITQAKKGI